MKKGYYIYYASDTEFLGVNKKVENQSRIFRQYFEFEIIVISKEETNFLKSIMWRLPFGSYGRRYEEAFEKIQNPDFIYVRFVFVDRKFLDFIKELRERYSNVKLLVEIPTYPYGQELLGDFFMLPFYYKDLWYRKQLKKYVDRIVTFSDDKEIFGIPTIRIMNGIVVDEQNIVCDNKQDDIIRLLAVAIFQKSHGYERIIRGLSHYYRKGGERKIELHMVGAGSELPFYKEEVKKYHLEEVVFFYGKKSGAELQKIYNNADIGLSCFGLYKRGISRSSVLKVREYLAEGLPVVTGCYEDILDSGIIPYLLSFPNDNSVIDVKRIVEFYDSIYAGKNRSEIHEKIRDFAKKRVDMRVVLRPIIEYIDLVINENEEKREKS